MNAGNKKRTLKEQGKADKSKKVGKLVGSAKTHPAAKKRAVESDTYLEGLFETIPTEFLQRQVDDIKNDREELEDFIKNAEMHLRIMLVKGKQTERDRWVGIIVYARNFLYTLTGFVHLVKALSGDVKSICTEAYFNEIKDDKEKLQDFINAAENDQQIFARQGIPEEVMRLGKLQIDAEIQLKRLKKQIEGDS